MGDDEQKDVLIGAPPADAGDSEPDPLGPPVPPDGDEEDDGE